LQSCLTNALRKPSLVSGTASDYELGVASKQAGAVWISSESITNSSMLAAHIESNYDETIDSFDDMTMKTELVRSIYSYGFERPSAVQQRVIMPVIKGEPGDGGDEQAAHESLG
jgi:hypothetical protein